MPTSRSKCRTNQVAIYLKHFSHGWAVIDSQPHESVNAVYSTDNEVDGTCVMGTRRMGRLAKARGDKRENNGSV